MRSSGGVIISRVSRFGAPAPSPGAGMLLLGEAAGRQTDCPVGIQHGEDAACLRLFPSVDLHQLANVDVDLFRNRHR